MPEVRSGEVQVGFFHQPIGRRFEASGHRCWLKSVDDSMTELSVFWILDQGCPLARKASFWLDPTPFQRFQVNWITKSIWISWISHDLFAWIYCWKTEWQQVGIHEHPKVPARETWSVSRHLKVSVCFYWWYLFKYPEHQNIVFLKANSPKTCYVSSWMSSDGILSMKKFNCARDCACLLSPQ